MAITRAWTAGYMDWEASAWAGALPWAVSVVTSGSGSCRDWAKAAPPREAVSRAISVRDRISFFTAGPSFPRFLEPVYHGTPSLSCQTDDIKMKKRLQKNCVHKVVSDE